MSWRLYVILFLGFILIGTSCEKDDEEFPMGVQLPESVEFGKSEIYRNGELLDYERRFFHWKETSVHKHFTYSFFLQQEIDLWHSLVFTWLPADTGFFKVGNPGVMHEIASTGFSQVVDEDLWGYSYELLDKEDGFIHITHLDTLEMTVKGNFEVKFVRTSKNGNRQDLGLPKYLYFQGVFYENYRIP